MAETSEMDSKDFEGDVTIANAAKLSSAFTLGGNLAVAVKIPAAFTGTVIKVLASNTSDGTFQYLYKDGLIYSTPSLPVRQLRLFTT
jgi:hypothetical protein